MKHEIDSGVRFEAPLSTHPSTSERLVPITRPAVSTLTRMLLLTLLTFALLLPVFGQDAESKAVDDFEAALFGAGDASGDATSDGSIGGGNSSDPVGTGTESPAPDGFDFVFPSAGDGSDVARIETLVGGTVVAQSNTVFSADFDSVQSLANAGGKIFAKVSVPDYGALYIAYNASHYFFQGYGGETNPFTVFDPYAPSYALAELHYSFDISKILFVRIGNQLIAWGPSRIWSPVDFINLQKSDAFANLDSRVGKPGLRLHLPLSRANVFAFADFSSMVEDRSGSLSIGGNPSETVNLGGRLDFTAGGAFEFGLTGYSGHNAQARFGADFSGRILGATAYGEFAWAPEYSDFTQSVQASLGVSRTLDELRLWTLSAEGFYNSNGRDLGGYTASGIMAIPASERTPLYQGEFYAYGALTAMELLSPSLSTTFSVLANLSDYSYSIKLAESISFPRSVPFGLSMTWVGGGKDKEFTRYGGDGAVSINLSTRLEF